MIKIKYSFFIISNNRVQKENGTNAVLFKEIKDYLSKKFKLNFLE